MKNRCIIVEDEVHSLRLLEDFVKKDNRLNIIATASDGMNAVKLINFHKPDIVFLDINLPEISGIELVDKLQYLPNIIFVTAYDNYAIEAFEKNAVDYILKPISFERLQKSINKILEKEGINFDIKEVLRKLSFSKDYLTRFLIKERATILIISQDDTIYFKAEGKYVFLCTYDSEFFYDKTLKNIESLVDPNVFMRIHKSYIVNINKVKKIHRLFGRKYKVELMDSKGTKLPISRLYLKSFLEFFK